MIGIYLRDLINIGAGIFFMDFSLDLYFQFK
jgi:hypothetical protein